MSVTLQYNPAPQPANGSTKTFFTTFSFLEASDLLVYVDGVLKSLDVDYEVSGEGLASGGSVTFFIEPLAGSSVLINRKTLASQPEDFVFNDALPTQVVERALDRCIMVVQELTASEGAYLRYPLGEENPQTLLPGTGDRAYKVLGFDGSGVLKMYLPSEIVGLGTVSPTIEDLTVYDNFVSSGLASVKNLKIEGTEFLLRKALSGDRIEQIYGPGTYVRYDPPSKGWDVFVDNNVVATLQGGQLRNVGALLLKLPTSNHKIFGLLSLNGNPVINLDANDYFHFGLSSNDLDLNLVDGLKFRFSPNGTFTTYTGNGVAGGGVTTGVVTAVTGNITTVNATTVNATTVNATTVNATTINGALKQNIVIESKLDTQDISSGAGWTKVLEKAITVSSGTKVDISAMVNVAMGASGDRCVFAIYRNGVNIANPTSSGSRLKAHASANGNYGNSGQCDTVGISLLDTHGTSGVVTYAVYCNPISSNVRINYAFNESDNTSWARFESNLKLVEVSTIA